MTPTLKKLRALCLALGMIFVLGWPSLAHAADTGGADHFKLTVVENKDSKSGAEIADLTIQNISGKTATDVTFEADLPPIFQVNGVTKMTQTIETLKAGEAKTYQVSRKPDGTVTTNPLPTTGTTEPATILLATGDVPTSRLIVSGLVLLTGIVMIGLKRIRGVKSLLAILLIVAGLGGAAVSAATTYHHRDEGKDQTVTLGGTDYVFHLTGEADFEGEAPPVAQTYTVTFDSQGGSAVSAQTDVAENATLSEPTAPSKTGYDFAGWYSSVDLTGEAWNFETDKMPANDLTLYAKWTIKTYTVTFDSNGGSEVAGTSADFGALLDNPGDPSQADFNFVGWYANAELTGTAWDFASDTMPASDLTLYAKWEAVDTATPGFPVPSTSPGTEFDFVDGSWRILATDMDSDPSNGLQALVIKVEPIVEVPFIGGGTTYFDTNGTNGYDRSRTVGGLGYSIDMWYETTIASDHTLAALVQAVALNNPDFTTFSTGIAFNGGSTLTNWLWSSYYQDNRFATSLNAAGSPQAFALSYGDIHAYLGVTETAYEVPLLDFSSSAYNYFWLRSAGSNEKYAGYVYAGYLNDSVSVSGALPARPALALLIKQADLPQ